NGGNDSQNSAEKCFGSMLIRAHSAAQSHSKVIAGCPVVRTSTRFIPGGNSIASPAGLKSSQRQPRPFACSLLAAAVSSEACSAGQQNFVSRPSRATAVNEFTATH